MVDFEPDYTLSFTYDKSKLQNPYISRAVLTESGSSVAVQVGIGKETVFAVSEICKSGEISTMRLTLGIDMYQDLGSTNNINDFNDTAFARRISANFKHTFTFLEYVERALLDRATAQHRSDRNL